MCGDFNLQPSKEIKAIFKLNITPDKLSGLTDDVGIVTQEQLTEILNTSLAQKVDKVEGKSLVEDTEIQRLSTLENYNDSQIKQDISTIKSNLDTKVDKVDGKQLSTNDFTNTLKSKLESVDTKAKVYSVNGQTGDVEIDEYTLPVASTTTLGGVKVDGTTITINNGVISSSGGSGETGTTNYNDLLNKPQINGVELSGNKTLDNLGIQAKGDYALKSDISNLATKDELNSLVQSPTSNYSNPAVYAGATYNQYVNLESIEVNHNIVSPFTKTIKMTEKGYYHISCVVRVIHTASEEGKPVSFVLQIDGTNYLQETIVLGSGSYTICTLAGTLYIEPNQVVSAMLWQNVNVNLTAQLYKLSAVRVYSPFDLDVLTPKVVEDSTLTTATIAKAEANTTYKYGTLTSLTVTEVENSPLPITVIFTTATSSPTINLPATLESINLADGFEAEKKYVLAIENNIAVIGSVE